MLNFKNEQSKLDWDDLRIVLAVAQAGSLSHAAILLNTSHPTVFRRIRAIEKKLAIKLFERDRTGYTATDAAADIVRLAQKISDDIHQLELNIAGRDDKPSGVVRLTSTDTLMFQLLPPLLQTVQQQLPEISLEVSTANNMFMLEKREADIALRAGGEAPQHLIARRLCQIESCIYHPADWQAVSLADIRKYPWVMGDASLAHLQSTKWLTEQGLDKQAVLRSNSMLNLVGVANAGMGMAILPCYLGDRAPGLRRLGIPMPELRSTLWLLSHPDLRRVKRIDAFIKKLQPALMMHRDLFEGRLPFSASMKIT